MAETSFFRVVVGGQDISKVLDPILMSLTVTDKSGTSSDTCQIELDDTGGVIVMPDTGAEVSVTLGWEGGASDEVFRGKVDEVKSRGSRGSGLTLSISAKGVDTNSKAKQPQTRSMDNKTVEEALRETGQAAGITDIRVDQQLRSIRRDFWGLDAESFIHFGERIAREIGGTFKISGNRAVLARRNSGQSPSGQPLPTVTAARGDNLIDWEISPKLGRARYRETMARWYDRDDAQWRDIRVQVPIEGAQASATRRHAAPNRDEAQRNAESDSADADKNKGGGRVTINGNVAAKPEGTCIVAGTRPGIDGSYRIEGVEHSFSRSGGFTTRLDLKQPSGAAGKDGRGSRAGGAASR